MNDVTNKYALPENALAVVGMACRFPGARNLDEFWDNLYAGRESITFFSPEELDGTLDPELVAKPNYVRAKGKLDDIDKFDAGFFGVSPIEANVMDPQQRILLELSWAAFEDAGIIPGEGDDLVGVWVGTNWNRYYDANVRGSKAEQRFGDFNSQVANEVDFPATRISYKLNLRGPSITLASACSTSLVAVGQAMQSLLNFECDVALAGGASVIVPANAGYLYQEGSMLSADGHCRPFDAKATGTTFNDGAAVVILKRLESALESGDRIYAVIRGVGVNNDGSDKVSYTAPSVSGQIAALQAALSVADVDPATVEFIETHGTATPLGDPIEVSAIKRVYGECGGDAPPCALGSLKSNIGHAIHAAGIAGLIKAALCVRNGVVPATLHFETPNPDLQLEESRFFINNAMMEWQSDGPRRAGVSSFGVGGTNAHVIVEQAPPAASVVTGAPGVPLFLLSAKDAETAAEQVSNLANHVQQHENEIDFGNAGFTLAHKRARFESGSVVFARSTKDLQIAGNNIVKGKARNLGRLVFSFPGQGAQKAGMGSGLIAESEVYAEALAHCVELANEHLDIDLGELVGESFDEGDEERISQTVYTQPALFAVGYALARHYESLGIEPDMLVGHSIGEFAAACIAGVFSLEHAIAAVCARGRVMQAQPSGSMLAVSAEPESIQPFLKDNVSIAAYNAPGLCVIAGDTLAVEDIAEQLRERQIRVTMLNTSHAFHSSMMEGALPEFRSVLSRLELRPPRIPIVSTATGRLMSDEEATSVEYWVNQIRDPVRFTDAVSTMLEGLPSGEGMAMLELGPGKTLTSLFMQQADGAHFATPSLGLSADDDFASSWLALGSLWCAGLELPTSKWWPASAHETIPLPPYPFRRDAHWIDAKPATAPKFDEEDVEDEPEDRPVDLRGRLIDLVNETTGLDLDPADASTPFGEIGLDSLVLTQLSVALQDVFDVRVTIRDLVNDLNTIDALYQRLESEVPDTSSSPVPAKSESGDSRLTIQSKIGRTARKRKQRGVRRGDTRPQVVHSWSDLGEERAAALREFIQAYSTKTAGSKAHTDAHRLVHADPRTASGFHRVWKEIVYPLVCTESDGAQIRDIDGNQYVDLLSGFGPNLLGHSNPLIGEAIARQLESGIEIGPQSSLAGETSALVCQLTGMDRATFMCTGSEAVQAALRCARTFTRRNKVVVFEGAYHGNFDEVLIRSANTTGQLRTIPGSPGVPRSSVAEMIVLPWANDGSLAVVDELGDQLAAVMVEPVQSRLPDVQPAAFLRQLREITSRHGVLLIFDEVVTGFRCHQGGAQAYFGVEADLATYGKVAGGNMPIGIVAGREAVMDTFDGGAWSYGDDSGPDASVTFFAGTFVRHPLAIAACHAMLSHLVEEGPRLQEELGVRTTEFAGRINALFEEFEAPFELPSFSSIMYLRNNDVSELGSLLWYYLRHKGVFALDGFPSYLTTAHTNGLLDQVVDAFRASLEAMVEGGFMMAPRKLKREVLPVAGIPDQAPVAGARLGAGPDGAPGWFVVDAGGRYLRAGETDEAVEFDPFSAGEIETVIVANESQQEVWSAAQLGDDASCAFNESVTLRFKGAFNRAAFEGSVRDVMARHPAMRTRLSPDGTLLKVMREDAPAITCLDAAECSVDDFVQGDVAKPFDLIRGPLFRFAVIGVSDDETAFVMTAHHIVCDGWSAMLILRELGNRYRANCGEDVEPLPAPGDLEAYNREASDLSQTAAEDYWLDEFETVPPAIDLPTDVPRPPLRTFDSRRLDMEVDTPRLERYKELAQAVDVSLFSLLLAGWAAYLARITDTNDIVVGIPSAGQPASGMPDLVGHCVNLLPIRVQVDLEAPFARLAESVKSKMMDALEYQDYTFGRLLKRLPIARDPSRVPLIPIQFNLDPPSSTDLFDFGELHTRLETNPRRYENFELFVNIAELNNTLVIQTQYNSNLYTAESTRARLNEYLTLLDAAVESSDASVGELRIMDEEERVRLVEKFNDTCAEFETDTHFLEYFYDQVATKPHTTAVISGDVACSYRELDDRSSRLASLLMRRAGDLEGKLVGIALNRGIDMVVSMLAVWKVGAAYVPLDPEFPAERLAFMIEDAGIRFVLSTSDVSPEVVSGDARAINLDAVSLDKVRLPDRLPPVRPDSRAYIIYTSGSTGRPKGVEIPHTAVSNFLQSMVTYPGLDRDDILLAVTTLSFDIAVLELFAPLICGAQVVIADKDDVLEGGRLSTLLQRSGATIMQATPVTWRMMLEAGWTGDARLRVLCGGEAFPSDLAGELASRCAAVYNMYGPTESTVWSAVFELDADEWREPRDAVVPIGRPIHNTQLYVLDAFLQPVPAGIPGELYIGGQGLALGYLNRDELTAERFVHHPALGRLYRTGDRVRQDAGGVLRFLERIDSQVKVRGFRIELGEIEGNLATHPSVKQAVVSVYEPSPGDARLAAYCLMHKGKDLDPSELRRHLDSQLPRYMIPQHFVTLDEIPMTPNRKVDRKALPALAAAQEELVAPRNQAEQVVADIWKQILSVDAISVHDDFFNQGGHSILAARVVSSLRDKTGVNVPLRTLFATPVLSEFAEHVAAAMLLGEDASSDVESAEREMLSF